MGAPEEDEEAAFDAVAEAAPDDDAAAVRHPLSIGWRVAVLVADFLIQVVLIVLGAGLLFSEEDTGLVFVLLLVWCAVGTVYWMLAVTALGIAAHRRPRPLPPAVSWLDVNPITRAVTTLATFLASLVGIAAAAELLLLRDDPAWGEAITVIAVWAMLLSWALFHWGFARMYARRYRLSATVPLIFPRTPDPGLVDFVYFAFSIGTAFATSDVMVTTPRMRWTVVWHNTFAFFFNAMIIVLAVNTLIR